MTDAQYDELSPRSTDVRIMCTRNEIGCKSQIETTSWVNSGNDRGPTNAKHEDGQRCDKLSGHALRAAHAHLPGRMDARARRFPHPLPTRTTRGVQPNHRRRGTRRGADPREAEAAHRPRRAVRPADRVAHDAMPWMAAIPVALARPAVSQARTALNAHEDAVRARCERLFDEEKSWAKWMVEHPDWDPGAWDALPAAERRQGHQGGHSAASVCEHLARRTRRRRIETGRCTSGASARRTGRCSGIPHP